MHLPYIVALLPFLVSAIPVALPKGNSATEVAGLAQASVDGAAESAAQASIADAIADKAPSSTVTADADQAQNALNTAEGQRASNQAAATNKGETTALDGLENVQKTEAQPTIDALKTPAGQTAANAASLKTTFAKGAAFNNAAKAAAAAQAAAPAKAAGGRKGGRV